jgi:hypothetical protein
VKLAIGVMGTSGGELSNEVRERAYQLGRAIADQDAILITGACPGLPYQAVRSAKAAGGLVVGISPGLSLDEHCRCRSGHRSRRPAIRTFPGREKIWRTIGEPQLLIISSYEMRLAVEPLSAASSRLTISIAYELPLSTFWRIVGRLLAGPYSRWCLRQMVGDATRALEMRAKLTV